MRSFDRDIVYLKDENQQIVRQMFNGLYLVVTAIIASYVAAVITKEFELHRLIMALGVSASGLFAIHHYKLANNAFYIREADLESRRMHQLARSEAAVAGRPRLVRSSDLPTYEIWKSKLRRRSLVITITDLLAATAGFYILWQSCVALWHGGQIWFAVVAGALALTGITIGSFAGKLAGK